MKKDFIQKQGRIGVTARIRRLNDKIMFSAKKAYQLLEIDIEPNWHLVLLLLKKEEKLTVTEIAKILEFTHPAIIKIVTKMKQKKYLTTINDPRDSRRQLLKLSKKAIKDLPELEEKWEFIREIQHQIISDSLLKELAIFENKLKEKSIEQRIEEKLEKTQND
ncbi:MarR family transcriptional regulator [Aquimarina sp. 2201CG5-10]|uniref:MarR family transcriptional regulator n=1 Tax=Aquimarina callyspongiae TaxID=3098150 RepID=UPI002AB4384A|nr:MarR family transcriptional regulator [Aquimarina sp. 2201CG5-10]MDY8136003.1 MarR family transcriptional regulator [Aquimarina sp. 2201CG5-10]